MVGSSISLQADKIEVLLDDDRSVEALFEAYLATSAKSLESRLVKRIRWGLDERIAIRKAELAQANVAAPRRVKPADQRFAHA